MEISVDFPDYEKGLEIDLGGLLVKNGESTEISEDQELAFVARHGTPVRDIASSHIKVSGAAKYTPSKIEQLELPQAEESGE